MPQQLTPNEEAAFRRWFAGWSQRLGLDPDPDAVGSAYDYRLAWRQGLTPDASGHWPSVAKRADHPNLVVGGFDTRTGQRVPTQSRMPDAWLVEQGWDPATVRAFPPEPPVMQDPRAAQGMLQALLRRLLQR